MSVMCVCVITGARADYGLLRPVMRALQHDERFELQLIVTGAHLSPEFGRTVDDVEADGFDINERVEMLLSSDTPVAITTSLGLATIGMAISFDRLRPDIVLVLGDRYEVLAAAQAAMIAKIPLAHLSGGDVTEGAIDDAIRHALSKFAHLHFTTNEDSGARVRQMGEDPSRVFVTGNPGLDEFAGFEPLERDALGRALALDLRPQNLLVTYHPVTLAEEPPEQACGELLAALADLGDDVGIVLTLPNADTWGRVIIDLTREFARRHDNAVAHAALGQTLYWSCLKTFDAVVGNSSSGVIEAPVVGLPAVNIGERQRGRLRSDTTIDCPPTRTEIRRAIAQAMAWTGAPSSSPYGDGQATRRIVEILASIDDPRTLLAKRFHSV